MYKASHQVIQHDFIFIWFHTQLSGYKIKSVLIKNLVSYKRQKYKMKTHYFISHLIYDVS